MEERNRILIADDEETNLIILEETLKRDYDLCLVNSAIDVIPKVKDFAPDLILLDVMMPVLSGHEICQRIKSDQTISNIPILFITALNDINDEAYGLSIGAVDFMTKPIRPAIVRARVKTHLSLVQVETLTNSRLQIIQSLGYAAEYKDNETGLHVIRMSYYAKLLALAAGFSTKEAEELFNAAPMHDIGKIGIPDRILQKEGKLNVDEWEIMKTHPIIGAKIIGNHESRLLQLARDISLSHHERWDGSGYPYGLKRDEISLASRIIAIVDVFDALTTARPYKKAWSVEEACQLLRKESGNQFDPNLVALFLDILPQVLKIKEQWMESQ